MLLIEKSRLQKMTFKPGISGWSSAGDRLGPLKNVSYLKIPDKAIKTACTAIRTKMTNPVKSGSSYIETMNTPTYGMHQNSAKFY